MFSSRSKSSSLSWRLVDDQLAFPRPSANRGFSLFRRRPSGRVGIDFLQLQDRILLHLLLDPLLQRHDRQLQDLHRLDHPRSQL